MHQGCFAGIDEIRGVVRLGACLEQLFEDRGAALLGSERQRSDTQLVSRFGVRAGAQQ